MKQSAPTCHSRHSRRSRRPTRRAVPAAVLLLAAAPLWHPSQAAVRTWIGGNTAWTDGAGNNASWSGADEPDTDDDALFNTANAVTLGSDNSVFTLSLSGSADLDTNGFDLTVNGLTSLSGAGTTLTVRPVASVLTSDSVTVGASAQLILDNGQVTVIEESGDGLFLLLNGTLIGHGTVQLSDVPAGVATLFNNNGVLTANTPVISIIFPPAAGTLAINASGANARIDLDGSLDTGIVNVNRNQTLDINLPLADPFSGDLNLRHNSTLDISSAWTFNAGTLDVHNGATGGIPAIPAGVAYIAGGTLTQSGGTLTVHDADGTLQLNAPFSMTGGSLVNNGLVVFNANATIGAGANFTMPSSSSSLTVNPGVTVTVNQANFNPDGAGVDTNVITINAGGVLDLNLGAGADESLSGTLNLNGGRLDVTTADNTWSINGPVNVGANTGTSIIAGEALTLATTDVIVGANSTLRINAASDWGFFSGLSVAAGANAILDGPTTISAVVSFSGAGTLTQDSSLTVNSSSHIGVATYDWDGIAASSTTTINAGATLTINATNIDVGNDTFNAVINNFGGTLNVTVADGEWVLGSGPAGAELNLVQTGSPAVLGGASRVRTSGTGRIVTQGNVTISAPLALDEGTALRMNVTSGTLNLNGAVELNGGDILDTVNRAIADTLVNLNAPLTVTGISAVAVEVFKWDGSSTTVAPSGSLSVIPDRIETAAAQQYDNVITVNSGALHVNLGAFAEWVMDGTLNLNQSVVAQVPVVSGDRILIGNDAGAADADLNVGGLGNSIIAAPVTFRADADVKIAPGAALILTGTADFEPVNGTLNGSFTGAGTLAANGNVTFAEATTLAFGTVDLDGLDAAGNPVAVNAPLTINANVVSPFGKPGATLTVDNNAATGILTVNLPLPADEWTLNAPGVLNLVNDNAAATLLAGNALNLNGTLNVTGEVRTDARLDIGPAATININTAGQPFRLSGGDTTAAPNTITGATINGPGTLGADTGSALHGFGTIHANIDFVGASNLRADNGTLTVTASLFDVGIVGTADTDGILNLTSPQTIAAGMTLELLGGSVIGAALANNSLIRGAGIIANNTTNNATGVIRPTALGTLRFTGINGANAGRIELNTGTAEFNNVLTNAAGTGLITGPGTLRANSNLTNNAAIQVPAGGPTHFFGVITNTATGSIAIAAGGLPTFDSNVVLQAGSTLTAAAGSTNRFLAALNVSGTVTLAQNVAATSIAILTINAGGSFDASNNRLIIDYSGATPADTIRSYILNGRLFSSTASADPDNRLTIGYAEASTLGVTAWSGLAVDATALLTRMTWFGDATLDGKVDFDDFARIDLGFAKGLTGWVNGDFNHSGSVTVADYLLIDRVFVQQGAALSPAFLSMRESQFGPDYVSTLLTSIPEPIATACLFAGCFLVRHRRITPPKANHFGEANSPPNSHNGLFACSLPARSVMPPL